MEKRKIMGIGLSALLFLSIAGTATGVPLKTAFAEEPDPDQTETEIPAPPAEGTEDENGASVSLTAEKASLFLPESYEEYLPLESPSYMAMSEHYIAVADGTNLYIYDRDNASYTCFSVVSLTTTGANISKIQITDDERLFFSLTGGRLYEYNFDDTEPTKYHSEVPCSTFLTVQDYLYAVSLTDGHVSLSRYNLSDLTKNGEQPIRTTESGIASKLSCADGKLYCVRNDTHIVMYDALADSPQQIGDLSFLDKKVGQVSDLKFVCYYRDYLYYTVNGTGNYGNGLWRTDFEGNAEQMIAGDGFSAINSYNGDLYCIRGASVLQLNVTDDGVGYSGYEIAASSSSENRLMNAVDSVRAGNLLVVADANANRVSVYDQISHSYSVIDCGFKPSFVATDGETIAVASEKSVYTCKYGTDELAIGITEKANIMGLACIYGSVYYVTENSVYGKIGEEQTAVHSYKTPQRLTCDLYGNLYVSNIDGEVYCFNEESFLVSNMGRKLDVTLPKNHTSFRADFEGNLYCLSGNTIYKNGEEFAGIDGNEFVYHTGSGIAIPSSFALGFEDSEVYFFFGNYAVKSAEDALAIPTLGKIAAGDIADEVFAVHGKDNLLIDVPAKTVGVKITLSELAEAEYFPYESYYRLSEVRRGVLLGATERYYLVLLPEGRHFTASLFRQEETRPVEEEYWTEPSENVKNEYYLSNSVSSYYAPCLETALADSRLERGTFVTVLGYVSAPDFEYALIGYLEGNADDAVTREIKTGYVPKSFLTHISPIPAEGTEYIPVYLKASEDGVLFTSADGKTLLVTERTAAKATENPDGTYTVCVTDENGKDYYATVDESQIDWQDSDALRIALIIILSVLALVIIGTYIFLLPKKSQKKEKTDKKSEKKE